MHTLFVRCLDSEVDIAMPLCGWQRFNLFWIQIIVDDIGGMQALGIIRQNTLPCIFRISSRQP